MSRVSRRTFCRAGTISLGALRGQSLLGGIAAEMKRPEEGGVCR